MFPPPPWLVLPSLLLIPLPTIPAAVLFMIRAMDEAMGLADAHRLRCLHSTPAPHPPTPSSLTFHRRSAPPDPGMSEHQIHIPLSVAAPTPAATSQSAPASLAATWTFSHTANDAVLERLLRMLRLLNHRRLTITGSRTEFALGLPVGTRDFHLLWEISPVATGGLFQISAQGKEADMKAKLLWISIAALQAAILGGL